ncbi:tetratricopeptide repeat protein [Flavobacterium fluviatile]|uniref:tetratricopeptide repeat protein n=1 Tax=Flavobacterium fluviatile TaxID=1862387 RepID=UPI0013D22357|nr:tetratricopeptide repeat protein [Flavobacterium fluviatile]
MNVTNYTYLINKPDAITEKQTEELGGVLIEFPYFQSARALRLKGLYNQNSFKYNYALKVTAAHTSDRSVLFDFITSETFTSIQGEYYDRKLRDLLNISVFDSEIVLAEEKKKLTEVRIDPIEKSILDSIKEATTATEEPAKIEEKTNESVSEQSILDSFEEVKKVSFKEPVNLEVKPIDSVSEQSILDSFKEVTNTFEKSEKIEENPIDSITEQPTLDSFQELTPAIEEKPAVETVSEPVLVKEPTRTFFDEVVEDEIPEVSLEPIDGSIYNSLVENATAVFEEVCAVEELKEAEVPETVKTAEENLEIGKPLDFSGNEKHSFQEWLQLARPEPIDRKNKDQKEVLIREKKVENIVENEMIDEEKKKKAEIIDKFIETNPKISPIKQTAINQSVQIDSSKEDNSYLMTETLARVYLEQKKYTKAIQAYEILILKYPEKITFFADRISDIKILQQNNNNNN